MNLLERLVTYFGESISAVEKDLGLSNGYISKYKSGRITNPTKIISALHSRGLNPAYFLTGAGSPEVGGAAAVPESTGSTAALVPWLEQKASAGPGKALGDRDEVCRYISIPESIAHIRGLHALTVCGDSMYPTLADGDVVICDTGGWSGDGIYVIRTAESLFVKRVVLTPGGYQVISDNALYPPYACRTEDAEMVGRVRCAVVRKL